MAKGFQIIESPQEFDDIGQAHSRPQRSGRLHKPPQAAEALVRPELAKRALALTPGNVITIRFDRFVPDEYVDKLRSALNGSGLSVFHQADYIIVSNDKPVKGRHRRV